ncbi:MAG: GTP cyclohydrolase I [Bacteroidaceae bacterium]|nr:GTP cyclohydrolase I [Bacteroidaceae bacterium]
MNNPTTQNGISQETLKESIRNIFQYIGENPDRLGLQGTPDRIARMFDEIFRGYKEEEKPHITVFQNGADGLVYDGMIVDSGTFYSCCEHHMMPFFGTYWFAYLPNPDGKILGISKVGRVIDYCSAKLQVQERLTRDVVQMLTEALGEENPPLGMALVMKGTHLCKTMRGARKEGMMTSSYLTGRFKSNAALRSEFLKMVDR